MPEILEHIDYITLDLNTNNAYIVIGTKEGDSARKVIISITENGQPYEIPSDVTATYRVRKPDGTAIWNNCTIEDNKVKFQFTSIALSVPGRAYADIVLSQG